MINEDLGALTTSLHAARLRRAGMEVCREDGCSQWNELSSLSPLLSSLGTYHDEQGGTTNRGGQAGKH